MTALMLSAYLAFPVGTLSSGAYAAIYKCLDSRGNTTYTSVQCPLEESTQLISKSARVVPELDCGVAEKLAIEVVSRMKEGELSVKLFNSYGGMGNLSPFVVDLVSYVYSFHGNNAVKATRITQLSLERCKAGSFGSVGTQCDIFPTEFIERLGGCLLASGSAEQNASIATLNRPSDSIQPEGADLYSLPQLGEANPVAPLQTTGNAWAATKRIPATQDEKLIECRQRLNTLIERANEQMSRELDPKNQKLLKIRNRHLKKQLNRC